MKKTLFLIGLFLCCSNLFSQVGINTTTPNAKLDIVSSNQATPTNTDGILIPKIDAFPIINPTVSQNGMLVFLTTTVGLKVSGFYYWDNNATSWIGVGSKNNWDLMGNSGTDATINFIGTIDNVDFNFRRNNIRAGKIETHNTSFGVNAFNPLNTSIYNSAFGDNSLSSNSSGSYNVAAGSYALNSNTIGFGNTAIGVNSLLTNNSGGYNTATGVNALNANTTASQNTANGGETLFKNTIGSNNTASGTYALHENTIGNLNVAIGVSSLLSSTTGNENTALGAETLHNNTIGSYNVAVGMHGLYNNLTGINNVAVGSYTLNNSSVSGNNNTGIGGASLFNTSGSDNTGLGYHSGINITTGSNNLTLGSNAIVPTPTASNQLSIANVIYGTTLSSTVLGKIGIGNSNPSSKLHIMGNTSGMTPNPSSIATVENNTNTYFSLLSNDESGILFGANGNATNGAIVYNPAGITNGMAFRTNNNTNQMIISSAGNVAIGNFIPNYPLHFSSVVGDKISLLGGGINHYGFGIQPALLQMYSADTSTDIAFGSGSSALFTENVRFKGNGNVGINAPIPDAKLQINASNQATPTNTDGVIIPKIDAFPLTNPTASQNGMMVFLTTTIGIKVSGFYYWDNTTLSWLGIGSKNNWGLNGNSGTNGATNFIGTTDDNDITFKRNNFKAGRIESTNTSLGSFASSLAAAGTNNTAIGVNSMNANISGNFNTAVGSNSLFTNTSGKFNTAVGGLALYKNTIGEENTAIGISALSQNTQGFYNVAVGTNALNVNTQGSANCAIGPVALYNNQTGNFNIGIGSNALYSNLLGDHNTAIGSHALYSNLADDNVAVGNFALYENTSGYGNSAIGSFALNNNVTGIYNTALGYYALNISTGSNDSAFGSNALVHNTTGNDNTASGSYAMYSNTIGSSNTANGQIALYANIDGNQNTATGGLALNAMLHGNRNTSTGYHSLFLNTTGSYNTAVGSFAYSTGNFSNSAVMGDAANITASNQVRLGDAGVTSIGGFANWTNVSDKRFKKDIQSNVPGLSFIKKLNPVTYRLDMDAIASLMKTPEELRKKDSEAVKEALLQTGFIAQEVEQAAKEMGFDFSGVDSPKNDSDFYGLRYAEFVVPLVKAVQEQQLIIENDKIKISALEMKYNQLEQRLKIIEEKSVK